MQAFGSACSCAAAFTGRRYNTWVPQTVHWRVRAVCPAAGRREWPWAQLWINQNIEISLKAWFGSVEVVRESKEPLDPNERYIFGYTPHGLFPIGEALAAECTGAKCAQAHSVHASMVPTSCRAIKLQTAGDGDICNGQRSAGQTS